MPKKLPSFLKPLFWEYCFADLSWAKDKDLIISRILTHGDFDSVLWLQRSAGRALLKRWIIQSQGRGLDRRRMRFWSLILNLPQRDVDQWLTNSPDGGVWDRRVG